MPFLSDVARLFRSISLPGVSGSRNTSDPRIRQASEQGISQGNIASHFDPHRSMVGGYESFSDLEFSDSSPSRSASDSEVSFQQVRDSKPFVDKGVGFESAETLGSERNETDRLEQAYNLSYTRLINRLDPRHYRTTTESNYSDRAIKGLTRFHFNSHLREEHFKTTPPNKAATIQIMIATLKEDPIIPAENRETAARSDIKKLSPEQVYNMVTRGMSQERQEVFDVFMTKHAEPSNTPPLHLLSAFINTGNEQVDREVFIKLAEHIREQS
ncbi:MAG: hypothetical protein KFB93_07875 [Simkaniaceae bacterium]|nr:MAG: hypothetical protein KFB93_07875 [Simkaniaceae bacterium]